jgi:hypothetical protein
MKHVIAAFSALSTLAFAAPASAQQALTTWTDATGRVSIDLSDSAWRGYALPAPDQPELVVMLLPPTASGDETGTPAQLCSLTQSRRPIDRPTDQAIANEMVRVMREFDDIAAWVDERAPPPADLVERDGVVSSYSSDTITHPQSGETVARARRVFILANADSLEFYRTLCIAFPRAGPEAPAGLRGMLERFRIGGVE